MYPKVKLEKIKSTHNNLRTDVMYGYLYNYNALEIGSGIVVMGESLDPGKDVRCIRTSPIQKIEGNRYFTRNSIYELTFLKDGL